MISYGDNSFHKNKAGVLDRHLNYAMYFDQLFIIHLTKTKNLKLISNGNLTIKSFFGINYFVSFFKAIIFIINSKDLFKDFSVITTQDPFLTGILGLMIKKVLKSKLHVQNHSVYINNKDWFRESPFINPILNFVGIRIIKRADRLRVVNSQEKEIYCKDLNIDSKKIDIAPVPSNDQFWFKELDKKLVINFKKKHNLESKLILGWAGRLVKFKRLDLLFEICSNLKEKGFKKFELLIAGDKKKSDFNLKKLEEKFNLKPIYLGYLNQDSLFEFYKIIDVYLHTSIYEGYGLVVKEAQLAGTPVISFATQGPSKIILEGVTGNLVEDNVESFSKSLSNYFDYSFLSQMKRNTLRHKKRFNEEVNIKNIIESICKTIE